MDDIDPEIIELVTRHIASNAQIKDDKYRDRLPEIAAAYKLIKLQQSSAFANAKQDSIDWEVSDNGGYPRIKMNIGGNCVQMIPEKLSDLRYTVAQLLHRVEHYT